ncbi:unnamed protein product [Diamesa serratosioi]
MQIVVKELKGNELKLEIDENLSILDMKEMIFKETQIPVHEQKLIMTGKILVNEKLIKDYNITGKLMLTRTKVNLRQLVKKGFNKFYTDVEAEKFTELFMTSNFEQGLAKYSFDDLEKLAAQQLIN